MEYKDLTDKIQTAVDELHKAVERQDDEIAKSGEVTVATKEMMGKVDDVVTKLLEEKAATDKVIADLGLKMERQSLVTGAGEQNAQTPEQKVAKDAFFKWVRTGLGGMNPDEQKALVQDSVGQYMIEPELDAEIERQLPTVTIVRGLVTVRQIGKDRIKMRSMGGVSVGWGKLETGSDVTESDLTPGAPTFQYVEDLYGLAKIGEDELMDSDVNLEAILAEEFARALGETEETAFIVGVGHDSNQPEGITVNSTLVTDTKTTAAASAVAIEDFLDMVYGCPTQFRRNGRFIVNSATELAVRKLRWDGGGGAGTGNYFWQPSVQAGLPNSFLGKPIHTQDDMLTLAGTTKCIAIFGDFKVGYRIIDRVGMSLQRLTELYSEAGLVGFKIHKRVTGGVMKASQKPLVLLTEHA